MEYVLTEHLRMSGVYWGLTDLMGKLGAMDGDAIVDWVMRCRHPCGGFGPNEGHDPHVLYTLSAVQVLALYDKLDLVDRDAVASYVASLQRPDGSFAGDEWGEIDTRFTYCALSTCKILGRFDALDVPAAVRFVVSCKNFDGGFGCTPASPHAGQIFTCVGALAIADALEHVDADLLGWWLCERQVKAGGLNGRPEKLPTCATAGGCSPPSPCSNARTGSIAPLAPSSSCGVRTRRRAASRMSRTTSRTCTTPSSASRGLSLMGFPGLKPVDSVYALPTETTERLGLGR